MAFLDSNAKYRRVNRAFEELYGYSKDEVQGIPIEHLPVWGHGNDEENLEIMKQGFTTGWSGEVVRKTKSGESIDILLTVAPVRDKRGEVIGRISISRDITERKKTAEHLTEQSRLASVGELAAGVAHEINNPLTSIILSTELLSETELPVETMADLAIISNSAQRAAKVVQSLLLFARRENHQPEPVSLESVIDRALELKKPDFRVNNIDTIMDIEPDLPNCLADTHQMSQVIVNILNNAEHALVTHSGCGEITIKLRSTSDTVTLEIHDNGPGIESDLMHKIFEPFYTTKQPGEGTGLGLSICHGIVQQHGGEMWAESINREGTSFFIKLPVTKAAVGLKHSTHQTIQVDTASVGRILVVDDEPLIRQIVAKGLTDDYGLVDQAPSGEVALDMILNSHYDCILLDLKMPGISGKEVFERTASYDHRIADRIVIMTGDTANPETASFLSNISNTVIHKPFTLREIKENLKGVLALR